MRFNSLNNYEDNINKPITEVEMLLNEINNIDGLNNPNLNDDRDNGSANIISPINNQGVNNQTNENIIDRLTPKRLIVAFIEDCWIKYQADDLPAVEYSGTTGQSRALTFIDNFSLDIGNAAGLAFTYGRQRFDNFGGSGIVLRNLKYHVVDNSLILKTR